MKVFDDHRMPSVDDHEKSLVGHPAMWKAGDIELWIVDVQQSAVRMTRKHADVSPICWTVPGD